MFCEEDRVCPITGQTINCEVCYEVVMCLTLGFRPESVPEMVFQDDEPTRKICSSCPYSDVS